MTDTERGMVEARARDAIHGRFFFEPDDLDGILDEVFAALTDAGLRIVDAEADDQRTAELAKWEEMNGSLISELSDEQVKRAHLEADVAALVQVLTYLDEQDFLQLPEAAAAIIDRYRAAQQEGQG